MCVVPDILVHILHANALFEILDKQGLLSCTKNLLWLENGGVIGFGFGKLQVDRHMDISHRYVGYIT